MITHEYITITFLVNHSKVMPMKYENLANVWIGKGGGGEVVSTWWLYYKKAT